MPVLTKKTVKGTGFKKNSQVIKAVFCLLGIGIPGISAPCASGTNPVGHTVGRKGIVITAEKPLIDPASHQLAFLVQSDTTETSSPLRNTAFIHTESAGLALLFSGRACGKIKRIPSKCMYPFYLGFRFIKTIPDAAGAQRQGRGNIF
jgi:hypothetical protein